MTADTTSPPSAAVEKPMLKLRKAGSASPMPAAEPPPPASSPPPPPSRSSPPPHSSTAKARPTSLGIAGYTQHAAWLLFLVLGGTMAAIRYGGLWDLYSQYLDEITLYGPYVLLFFHAVLVLLAFSDDLFTGVLCVLIPGYSLYYLLMKSGRPFLIAVVFGLLAGLGEDSFYILRDFAMQVHDTINDLLKGSR